MIAAGDRSRGSFLFIKDESHKLLIRTDKNIAAERSGLPLNVKMQCGWQAVRQLRMVATYAHAGLSGAARRLGQIPRRFLSAVCKLLAEAAWPVRLHPTDRRFLERIQQGSHERKEIALVATSSYLVRAMHAMRRDIRSASRRLHLRRNSPHHC